MTARGVTMRDALAPMLAERLAQCADGGLRRVAEEIASEMLRKGGYDLRRRDWTRDPGLRDAADTLARLALERAADACDVATRS